MQSMSAPSAKAHVTVANTSTTILAANPLRTHAIIKASSDNTEPLFLAFGPAAVVDYGPALDPGESFQIKPDNMHTGIIVGICASGGMTAEPFEA